MRKLWEDELTRRSLLKIGVSSAALLAMPWSFAERSFAQGTAPHFLVTFFGDGGWDPTQVFDVHDPLDMTDGVDVDVPGQRGRFPASSISRTRRPVRTSTSTSTTGRSGPRS
jgi:hypothetical protein